MTAPAPVAPKRTAGFFSRPLIRVAGVDEETLCDCPAHDWENARAIGLLMIGVSIYRAGLIAAVAHRLFAPNGTLHPAIVLASIFIATLILLLDSYLFCRAAYHGHGLKELARGGLKLPGGFVAKVAAVICFGFRILLSLSFAQLTAIFVALIIYQGDIAADLDQGSQQQNAAVIGAAQHRADAEIERDGDAVKEADGRVNALEKQIAATLSYLRGPTPWRNAERARQAQAALPELESDLRTATGELGTLRDTLKRDTDGRDKAVQAEVNDSPQSVKPAAGILAQLSALRRIASNPETAFVILLVDITAFGLELSAVLATQIAYVPTTYAALLARNAYVSVVVIVDEMEQIINRQGQAADEPITPRGDGRSKPSNATWFPADSRKEPPPLAKRPRGRPRKDSRNGQSPPAAGEDKGGPNKDNEGQ